MGRQHEAVEETQIKAGILSKYGEKKQTPWTLKKTVAHFLNS